jgi:Mn-dependent DtxR family transcriptional regulator
MTTIEQIVYNYIQDHPTATRTEIAEALFCPVRQVSAALYLLKRKGYITLE